MWLDNWPSHGATGKETQTIVISVGRKRPSVYNEKAANKMTVLGSILRAFIAGTFALIGTVLA